MARLGPRFWPQRSPRKSLCGSLFCILSQEMRHINFLGGGGVQNGGFWVGGKKFMLKKFMCFFRPLIESAILNIWNWAIQNCSIRVMRFQGRGQRSYKRWQVAIQMGDSEKSFCDATLLWFDSLLCFPLWKLWQLQACDSGILRFANCAAKLRTSMALEIPNLSSQGYVRIASPGSPLPPLPPGPAMHCIVARIARCHFDMRCDSNRRPPNRAMQKHFC